MSTETKLAILRMSEKTVDAWVAALPAETDSSPKLQFAGPHKVTEVGKAPLPSIFRVGNGRPKYDEAKNEIKWVVYGSGDGTGKMAAHIWRIGKYFSVNSDERTPLLTKYAWYLTPTAVFHGDLMTVCSARYEDGPNDGILIYTAMAQKGTNTAEWTITPYNSKHKESTMLDDFLFQGLSDTTMVYTYHARANGSTGNILILEQMQTNLFRALSKDSTSQWQEYQINMGFSPTRLIPFITTVPPPASSQDKTFRVYFFKLNGTEKCIEIAYISLRKDGSVNSTTSQVKATAVPKIPVPTFTPRSRYLHVIPLSQQRILLFWDRVLGAKIGTVGADGALSTEWTDIEISIPVPYVDRWWDNESVGTPFGVVALPDKFFAE